MGRQHGTGISIAGDTSVDVFDCWIHHTWSDGIFLAGWGDTDDAPYGYEWAYNLVELTGRYAFVADQNDSGTAWFHHNILRDTGAVSDRRGGPATWDGANGQRARGGERPRHVQLA